MKDAEPVSSAPLLRVLAGEALNPPPIWLMRQAGRYLPEYRAVRKKAGSFLDLCYNPDLAAEVTLQPIRRYAFDAAILFSDILVVPHALGQEVRFVEGRGPVLDPIRPGGVDALDEGAAADRLSPMMETLRLVRRALDDQVALIGFCGAPWTVATYMIAGQGTPDQMPARLAMLGDAARFGALVSVLERVSVDYLVAQADAGADVVQIFDTWAGVLDEEGFEKWALAPLRRMVGALRARRPSLKIIVFAKGAGTRLGRYAMEVGADGVGVDWSTPIANAVQCVPDRIAVQGNLDPARLVAGGEALRSAVLRITAQTRGRPHIFNLGHGIVPQTPPDHVSALVSMVREG